MSETSKQKNLPRYRGYSRLTKGGGNNGHLTLPAELMNVLTEGLLFKPELNKDGILFRVIDESKMISDEKAIPAWAKAAKPKRTTTTGEPEINSTANGDEPDIEAMLDSMDDDANEADAEDEAADEPPTEDDDAPF